MGRVSKRKDMSDAANIVRKVYWHRRHERAAHIHGTRESGVRSTNYFDGGVTSDGRTFTNVWEKIATRAAELRVHPESFVVAQFETTNYELRPQHLLSKDAATRCQHYFNTYQARLADELQAQRALLRTGIEQTRVMVACPDEKTLVGQALLGSWHPTSPLYRYCFAERYGFAEASELRAGALRQLLRDRLGYGAVWQAWIPEELQQEAASLMR